MIKINESYSGNHEELNFDLKNLAVSAAIAALGTEESVKVESGEGLR